MHSRFAARIENMSAVKGRAQRPPGKPTRLLQGRVDPGVHAKATIAAHAAGISVAAYLEALVERDEVDAFGLPRWLPARPVDQEELPLTKTA